MRHMKNMVVVAALAATAIAGSWAISQSQDTSPRTDPVGTSHDTLQTGQSGHRSGSTMNSKTSTKSSTSGTTAGTRHVGSKAGTSTSDENSGSATMSGEKWSSSTTGAAKTAYERSVLASGTHKSLSGEVVEVSCYLQLGQHGAANAEAMRAIAEHGGTVGILTTDRTLYLVFPEEYQMRNEGSINAANALASSMGRNVTMNGTVVVQKGMRGFFVPQSEINRFGGGAAGGSNGSTGTPGGGGGGYQNTTPGGAGGTTPGGTTQQPGGGMMRDTSSTTPGATQPGSTNPGGTMQQPGGSSSQPGGGSSQQPGGSGSQPGGGTQGSQPDSTGRSHGNSLPDSTGTRPPR